MTLRDAASLAFTQAWQLTALIVLVTFIVRFSARRSPHLAHVLWLVVLVKCLTPPIVATPGGVFCWLQAQAVQWKWPGSDSWWASGQVVPEVEAARNSATIRHRSNVPDLVLAGTTHGDESPPAEWPEDSGFTHSTTTSNGEGFREAAELVRQAPASGNDPWTGGLRWLASFFDRPHVVGTAAVIWVTGTVALFLLAGMRLLLCLRHISRQGIEPHPELETLLADLRQRLGVRRRVRLIVSASRVGPAVVGLWRPTIILPAAIVRAQSLRSLEVILAHELIHVRRGDLWLGLVQVVALGAWWFHPLVWLANRRGTLAAEACCDEEVIAELGCDSALYAGSLVEILELKRGLISIPSFPGMRPVDITRERLERIMQIGQGCHRRTPWWCWVVLVAACAATLPGAALISAGQEVGTSVANSTSTVTEQRSETRGAAAAATNGQVKNDRQQPDAAGAGQAPDQTASSGAGEPAEAEGEPDQDLRRRLAQALVTVIATGPASDRREKSAVRQSGLIVDERGYVLTLLPANTDSELTFTIRLKDSSKHAAEVVATDPRSNLAVLRFHAEKSVVAISLGHNRRVDAARGAPAAAGKNNSAPGVREESGQQRDDESMLDSDRRHLLLPLGGGASLRVTEAGEPVQIHVETQSGEVRRSSFIPLNRARQLLKQALAQVDEYTTRTYSIADLINPIPSVRVDLSPPTDAQPASSMPPSVTKANFAPLIELIQSTVAPETWDSVGGEGSIRPFETTLSLVVRQTESVHEDLAGLLSPLRQAKVLEVVLDVELSRRRQATQRDSTATSQKETHDDTENGRDVIERCQIRLHNGQGAELLLRRLRREGADQPPVLRMVPLIAGDRKSVRLKIAFGASNAVEAIAWSSTATVLDRESTILNLSHLLLAERLGMPFLEADLIAERLSRLDPAERFFLTITPKIETLEEENERIKDLP